MGGGGGEEGRGRDLGRGVSLLLFFYSFPFPFLRLLPRLADIIRLILISNDQCCYPLLVLMLIFLPDIITYILFIDALLSLSYQLCPILQGISVTTTAT